MHIANSIPPRNCAPRSHCSWLLRELFHSSMKYKIPSLSKNVSIARKVFSPQIESPKCFFWASLKAPQLLLLPYGTIVSISMWCDIQILQYILSVPLSRTWISCSNPKPSLCIRSRPHHPMQGKKFKEIWDNNSLVCRQDWKYKKLK